MVEIDLNELFERFSSWIELSNVWKFPSAGWNRLSLFTLFGKDLQIFVRMSICFSIRWICSSRSFASIDKVDFIRMKCSKSSNCSTLKYFFKMFVTKRFRRSIPSFKVFASSCFCWACSRRSKSAASNEKSQSKFDFFSSLLFLYFLRRIVFRNR